MDNNYIGDLSDDELYAKIELCYYDYPLVMELLLRAKRLDGALWLARLSTAARDDDDGYITY